MMRVSSLSGSIVSPVAKIASPLVFQRSISGASEVSLNFVTLIEAGRMFGPVRSSQPRMAMPPGTCLQMLLHRSLSMTLPSSQSSSGVTPPIPSTSSRTLFPQQPSPMANCGQSDPCVHGPFGGRVHLPMIVHIAEHGLPMVPLGMPRSHCSDGKSKIPSPQSHSTAEPPAQAGGQLSGHLAHAPASGRPLHGSHGSPTPSWSASAFRQVSPLGHSVLSPLGHVSGPGPLQRLGGLDTFGQLSIPSGTLSPSLSGTMAKASMFCPLPLRPT